jgi:hypothetical protein
MGVVLILVGLVGWGLEDVYGGDPDRQEYMVGHEAETGLATVYGENGEVVYETTSIDDAEAWVGNQRGGRHYAVPGLLIAGGAMAVIAAVSPSPTRRELSPSTPARADSPPAAAH